LAAHESALLWRREMIRGLYQPRLLPVRTPQGEVTALVFGVNTAHDDHVGELPLDDTAAIIARAEGVLGSNRHYLEQLVWQLEHLGIVDPYLQQLLDRVQQMASP
jgi:cation transport protein ChaC